MWAAAAFLLAFLLLAPKSRALLGAWLGDAGKWMAAWAPFSYVIVLVVLLAPIVSFVMMARWPHHVEPPNPMSRYKQDDVMPA